jgi:DNA polymerase-3 subunit beta
VKLRCTRQELQAKLQIVGRGLSTTRTSVQILSGIRLTAPSAELPAELSATDMEISLRAPLEADVLEPGEVVLSGRSLLEWARTRRTADVELEQPGGNGKVQLTAGTSIVELVSYPPEDFPQLPAPDPERLFRIDRDAFLATTDRVLRAASRDESRPVLTGVLAEIQGDGITMAATDSYRMAVKQTPLEQGPPEDLAPIIPARALQELQRIAAAMPGEELELSVDANQVIFGLGGVWLTSRRIDGQFPNYRQLRPDAFEHDVVLGRQDLIEVLRGVEPFAQRNSPLRLRFSDGELQVSAQTQEVGSGEDRLPCDFRGETLEIGFNAAFLRDGVESVDEDEVHLKLISPLRPGLVTGSGDEFWYLVMPIRLSG